MTKIAILQSNYIPWKGVFDLINQVDKFVFFEDVQFTKRDWRTRNKIKTKDGELWLSVPVKKAPRDTKICDIEIASETDWQKKHFESIRYSYSKAPYYNQYYDLLEYIYLNHKWTNLSEFNIQTTQLIARKLGIDTEFYNSRDLNTSGSKDDKLIEICKKLNGNFYLSGPSAKDYIINQKFEKENIDLAYIIYEYPGYNQLYGEFNHYVSVLDVLFHCGDRSQEYILGNQFEQQFYNC